MKLSHSRLKKKKKGLIDDAAHKSNVEYIGKENLKCQNFRRVQEVT